jgi:LL-diaminopimelate aminotransferase
LSFSVATRLKRVPPYPFEQIAEIKARKLKEGVELVDFGIGDPDLPTPPHIIEALCNAARDPATHTYDESGSGLPQFREAVAAWYRSRFGVQLDPGTEVQHLIGSKEGIAHIFLAFVEPGECCLVPDPRYMVYSVGASFAGGWFYPMPLRAENGFLPDLDAIPDEASRHARIMFLNYPNNPTGAVAPREFFEKAVDFARGRGILLCHDCAYSEVAFDGIRPDSILSVEGAKEVAVEFHSLSKTYNMTGWRLGFVVGNREVLAALRKVKSNVDSGVFMAIQRAGVAALTGPQKCVEQMRATYQERRDRLVAGMNAMGWKVAPPQATFYVWAKVPGEIKSAEFAQMLLEEGNVLTIPGALYGREGERYVRLSLTVKGPQGVDLIGRGLENMERVVRRVL